ncbi:MAG: hypothetical protein ACR2F8_06510 [Caulobacteraceae bacterium]
MTSDSIFDCGPDDGESPAGGDWRRDLALIALPALALFAVCLVDQPMFADGDSNWHVAAGRWILAHRAVPLVDPFSYTALGRPWVAHEWLSEVLMALAWRAAGWSGVMVLIAAAAATSLALVTAELRRSLGTLSVIVALSLGAMVLAPHLLARPHVLALPLLVLWTGQLLKARRRERAPPLWLLPVMTVWANLHGSFIFGLAFTAFFALEAFLAARGPAPAPAPLDRSGGRALSARRRVGGFLSRQARPFLAPAALAVAAKWGAFLIAASAMALITPNGLTGLTYPLHVMSMKYLDAIGEWRPARFKQLTALEVAVFFTLFVCLYRGVRMGAARLGLILVLLYMTFQHIRQEVILMTVGPLLLAEPLGRALAPARANPRRAIDWPPFAKLAAPAAVAVLLFALPAAWRLATPDERTDRFAVPVTALAHVPAVLRAKPVFNDYSFGGWLVFNGVRPFMDGRSDMYGDDLLKLYLDVERADPAAVARTFSRYDIQWTILSPRSPLVKRLDATAGWRRLYADKWAVVQVREDTPTAPAGAR